MEEDEEKADGSSNYNGCISKVKADVSFNYNG